MRDALVAEVGLDYAVGSNISLGVSWTGQFADKAYDNTVKAPLPGGSESNGHCWLMTSSIVHESTCRVRVTLLLKATVR
ncbi:MAG: hypothetical protein WBA48_18180 [Xanthobacteraceae bacterium]